MTRAGGLALAAGAALLLTGCDAKPAQPAFTEAVVLAGERVQPETLEQGRRLYGRYCVSCHGPAGDGKGPAAGALPRVPRDFRSCEFAHASHAQGELPSHSSILEVISKGAVDAGMPAWRGLNPIDLDAVGRYVETFCPAFEGPAQAAAPQKSEPATENGR